MLWFKVWKILNLFNSYSQCCLELKKKILRVLLPCSEILRFYYCFSFNRLLLPPEWSPQPNWMTTKTPRIASHTILALVVLGKMKEVKPFILCGLTCLFSLTPHVQRQRLSLRFLARTHSFFFSRFTLTYSDHKILLHLWLLMWINLFVVSRSSFCLLDDFSQTFAC